MTITDSGDTPGQFSSLDHDFDNEPPIIGILNDVDGAEVGVGVDQSASTVSHHNPSSNRRQGSGADLRASSRREQGSSGFRSLMRFLNNVRLKCGAIVNHNRCQMFIVLLIIINAIMIGIGTFDFVTDNPHLDDVFQKVDRAFLIIFTIELVMQFIYHGLNLLRDGWLVFDLVIIVMSWAFESIQIIRAFRIFRVLRLITRIEVLRNLVSSLFAVFPRLSAIGCLLLLIFYIFAVMFTTLYKDLELSQNYFTNLGASLFTLFQFMTMEWSEISREVMQYNTWAWLPFVVFVAISGFIVFNLIIAVICDAVAIIESEKHEDEGAPRASCSGTQIDEASQKKIQDLNLQMLSLINTQREMQQQIEHLAREYYALRGLLMPPSNGVDGDVDDNNGGGALFSSRSFDAKENAS